MDFTALFNPAIAGAPMPGILPGHGMASPFIDDIFLPPVGQIHTWPPDHGAASTSTGFDPTAYDPPIANTVASMPGVPPGYGAGIPIVPAIYFWLPTTDGAYVPVLASAGDHATDIGDLTIPLDLSDPLNPPAVVDFSGGYSKEPPIANFSRVFSSPHLWHQYGSHPA